jgi:DNA-binding response OmpR family regulator
LKNAENKSLMLVEDDAHLVMILSDLLSSEGFNVIPFFAAEDALPTLRSWRPDLIILDIAMPGMNGNTFLKLVKDVIVPRVPILVHSAVADPNEMIKDAHVDAVVPKGHDPSVLVCAIRQILGMKYYFKPNA